MMLRVSPIKGYQDKTAPPDFTVEVPDDSRCKWDVNQRTLLVLDPAGNHLAAFLACKSFYITEPIKVVRLDV